MKLQCIYKMNDGIKGNKKKKVYYGTGIVSEKRFLFLKEMGIKIDYLCDNSPENWGKTIWGLECISHERLLNIPNVIVIIGSNIYKDTIRERLIKMGIPEEQLYYDNLANEYNDSFLDGKIEKFRWRI